MKRLAWTTAVVLPLFTFALAHPYADVKTKTQSNIKFEGFLGFLLNHGKAAKEGLVSTAAVKGNRKATTTEDRGEIIDLGEEKVYKVDYKKKEYSYETFEQIRQRMREEAAKAREQQEKQEKQEPQEKGEPQKPEKEYQVDFDVKDTGQKKQILNYDTHETIVTVTVHEKGRPIEESGGVIMTSDMWLGPRIPELKELVDFDMRYWKALQEGSGVPTMSPEQMAQLVAAFPLFKQAMDRMQKDGDKLSGTALDTTMTLESVKSKDQSTQSQQPSSPGGLGGMLARKMMKKNDSGTGKSTVFTSRHQFLEISKSVDTADLAIPAGFKDVTKK